MKHLIVYSHPNPASYNHAVLEIIADMLKKNNNEVKIRDLYSIPFDPVLKGADFASFQNGVIPDDIRKEQGYIRWADVVTFIFPIWWFQMPAMLKGYIDRVFSKGFAYDITSEGVKGLLSGKKVVIINTTGGPEDSYVQNGFKNAIAKTMEDGIFLFSGMEVASHKFLFAVPFMDEAARKAMLEEVKKISY